MALFVPDSEIYLLKNIPFTPDYRNTGLFANKESQGAIMQTRAFYHAQNCTYVRETGRIRLEIPIAQAWQCNYIMYRNTNFYNKWFYAFVTAVNYINNETSELTFQLDIMQTFLFDYTEKPCFIERQHAANDALGSNLVPEGLEIGELTWSAFSKLPATYGKIYVAATFDKQLNNYKGGMFNNVYTGLCINEFNTVAEVTEFINSATSANKLSGIVSIFQSINYNTITTFNYNINQNSLFGGYRPKNNKLYTYPYTFFQILGNDGGNAIFRWEYFNQFGQAAFQIATSPSLSSQMLITPTNYKGKTGYNPAERMIIENVMLCSWNGDTFKANLAQTIGRYGAYADIIVDAFGQATKQAESQKEEQAKELGEIQNAIATGKQMSLGEAAAATWQVFKSALGTGVEMINQAPKALGSDETLTEIAQSGVKNVLYTVRDALKAFKAPESMSRQAQNPGASTDILYMLQEKSPYFVQMSITPYYARIIDDYFTMYGYQTNRVQNPNRRARTRYTYIKTAGAIIEAEFPASIAQAIENIYNNGICFWWITGTGQNTLDGVGNYENNNPIA